MEQYPFAHDMREMLPIFDDDTKSEFYYLPKKEDGSYKIL